jgi:hypothetical protein
MFDYQKGKIYKLWSPSKNLVYYGSTTQTISQRLSRHLKCYENYEKTNHYYSSFIILECEDYKIELVEEYPCNNKTELEKQEGEYIKNNKCVNTRIEGRTDKEYRQDNKEQIKKQNAILYNKKRDIVLKQQKIYYENNKEKKLEKNKIWFENNKEKVIEYRTKYNETKKQNNAIYKWLLMTGIIQ